MVVPAAQPLQALVLRDVNTGRGIVRPVTSDYELAVRFERTDGTCTGGRPGGSP
ncbi:hypothetical protein HRW23_22920 [Streptomyces lunaelactis]|uniref:hypothetical protein n=1 Tax=Streptomyces lunaelactis TaxID=1535768 RepID=UPI0015846FE1|nr:hypothetical protein [Streptomyces lunaelactis]NUK61831.1 hypothetical protein [Streptomyces lunaelactis]NUK80189.1 hypothetical protein [Streptomyces lunaelactis]NUL15131.1 hypothetical protein [Streptomyces lunaelactis]